MFDAEVVDRILQRGSTSRSGQTPRIVIPPRVGRVTINLRTAAFFTPWIASTNKFLLSADVQELDSFTTSTTWVVGLHWTIMKEDYSNAVVASPVIQWSATTPATRNENIAGIPFFRFFVVTAEADADPNANIVYAVE